MARPRKAVPQISGELLAKLPPLPEAGPLDTMTDLQREWQRLQRGRDRGQIDPDKYRDLAYGLQVGQSITRACVIDRIEEQLAAVGSSGIPALFADTDKELA